MGGFCFQGETLERHFGLAEKDSSCLLLLLSSWDLPALREITFKNCYANTRRDDPDKGTLGAIPSWEFTWFRRFVGKQRLTALRLINTCIAGHDLLDMLRRHAATLRELTIADNDKNERSAGLPARGPLGDNGNDLRMASAAAVFGAAPSAFVPVLTISHVVLCHLGELHALCHAPRVAHAD